MIYGDRYSKRDDMSTNQILRFFDDHMTTGLTFQKIHFSIYILLVKKAQILTQTLIFFLSL